MSIGSLDKIVIVSLCDRVTEKLAKSLSQRLEMMYCNTKDLIEYELIDKNKLKKISSKEYLDNAERSVLKHIASFSNVLVSISYDYLFRHIDLLKDSSLIIFVKFAKSFVEEKGNVINKISYDSRTKTLENLSNLTVSVKKTDLEFMVGKVISEIGRLL